MTEHRAAWLSAQIGENHYTGVELGVLKGPTFKAIVTQCSNVNWYGVDVFTPDKYWLANKITETKDLLKFKPVKWYPELLEFCKQYPDRAHIIRDFTNRAYSNFKDKSLDIIFIDASHDMDSVNEDIKLWAPKVKPGGIISGHDINMLGVRMAVSMHSSEYEEGPDNIWFYKNNG